MTVKDVLTITGGNTNFYIQGTTEKDEIIQLAHGRVDDIKFPLVPYGEFEVQHISVDENCLYIILDGNINFANINPGLTDINCNGFTGYINEANNNEKYNWIPTSSGLFPNDLEDVQVTYVGYNDHKPYCNAFAYRKENKWYWTLNESQSKVEIIAWKYNCKPYKKTL